MFIIDTADLSHHNCLSFFDRKQYAQGPTNYFLSFLETSILGCSDTLFKKSLQFLIGSIITYFSFCFVYVSVHFYILDYTARLYYLTNFFGIDSCFFFLFSVATLYGNNIFQYICIGI